MSGLKNTLRGTLRKMKKDKDKDKEKEKPAETPASPNAEAAHQAMLAEQLEMVKREKAKILKEKQDMIIMEFTDTMAQMGDILEDLDGLLGGSDNTAPKQDEAAKQKQDDQMKALFSDNYDEVDDILSELEGVIAHEEQIASRKLTVSFQVPPKVEEVTPEPPKEPEPEPEPEPESNSDETTDPEKFKRMAERRKSVAWVKEKKGTLRLVPEFGSLTEQLREASREMVLNASNKPAMLVAARIVAHCSSKLVVLTKRLAITIPEYKEPLIACTKKLAAATANVAKWGKAASDGEDGAQEKMFSARDQLAEVVKSTLELVAEAKPRLAKSINEAGTDINS